MANKKVYALGMDIGYSALKLAMGYVDSGAPKTLVLPAGAGPAEMLPRSARGATGSAIRVLVNGNEWVAGVEPSRLQGWTRELHEDYSATDNYKALFYAALACSEENKIDFLVTGLPSSQYKDDAIVERLRKQLVGKHQIAPKREVEVCDVVILPQPAGAYVNALQTCNDEKIRRLLEDSSVLVLDPGYFSYDWALMVESDLHESSCGTSLKAMSIVLEETNTLISKQYGVAPGVDPLERRIRNGEFTVPVGADLVDVKPYFDEARASVVGYAVTEMRNQLRNTRAPNVVIIAGGGATAWEDQANELFKEQSKIIVPENPVLANALGFWAAAS